MRKAVRRALCASTLLGMGAVSVPCSSAAVLPAGTKSNSEIGIDVKAIYIEGSNIHVDLQLDLSKVKMNSSRETIYTPMFVNGTDTVRLPAFSVTGRGRMYWDRRNDQLLPVTFYKKELLGGTPGIPAGSISGYTVQSTGNGSRYGARDTYDLNLFTMYREWMEDATFAIDTETLGCADCLKQRDNYSLARTDFVPRTFAPEFVYATPVAEAIKMREISARAYIDFPVNQVEIYPDYRRNPAELAKIRATIDSVRNDKDINITSLHISGTASPEGSYQNNVRLASGRTEALKNYVQGLYRFPEALITTSFEPVDWQGLVEFLSTVVYSGAVSVNDSIRFDQFRNIPGDIDLWKEVLPSAQTILSIVNSNLEPVARNNKIRNTYPKEYAWLLENVYPALRHSDYRIQFEIKTYTEVSEILEVMATKPQNLSLAELFVAANSQEEGSDLYNRAIELAVGMYPDDQTANLNAAVAAMQRGDMINAERYLAKVTDETPESDYARAMMLQLQGNQDEALPLFRSLSASLNPVVAEKATRAVEGIEAIIRANNRTFVLIE